MAPADEDELRHMLYTALRWEGGPIALRFPRGGALGVPLAAAYQELPIGRAQLLQAGEDVALVGYGTAVEWCRDAAALLQESGLTPTVVNARFAKPLDEELLLRLVRTHRYVLLAEEHALMGGFGSAVLEMCESHRALSGNIHRLGIPDRFIEHAARGRQLEKLGLTAANIARLAREALGVPAPVQSLRDREVSRQA
jgi:1-deoxy-D-xylulose-5-phosphate synthase